MSKLTNCLEIVKNISKEDSDAVLAALEEYTDAGMVPSKAQVKATQDVLREIEAEKVGYQDIIDEQLPVAVKKEPVVSKEGIEEPAAKETEKKEKPEDIPEPAEPVKADEKPEVKAEEIEDVREKELYSGYEREDGDLQIREPATDEDAAQASFDLEPAPSVPAAKQQAKDNLHVRYKQVKSGEIRSGLDTAISAEHAAHVLAPIRKHGQETLVALVTDKKGKILNIIRHAKGARAGASVFPGELVTAIAATDNAATVWVAHNHPSGDPKPSGADYQITRQFRTVLEGTGIDLKGHVVLGSGTKAWVFQDEDYSYPLKIKPMVRKRTHAITERMLRKVAPADLPVVDSPASARNIIDSLESDNALILLDNRHKVVGTVVFSAGEMSNLRKGGNVLRILRAIDHTNASAGIVKSSDKDAAANLARFLNTGEKLRLLDAFIQDDETWYSSAERGRIVEDSQGVWFSAENFTKTEKGEISTVSKVNKYIADQVSALSGQYVKKIKVVKNIDDLPTDIREAAKKAGIVAGAYSPINDTVYLVASNIHSKAHAQRVLAHELTGHMGMEYMLGEGLQDVLNDVQKLKKAGDKVVMEAANQVESRRGTLDAAEEAKEIIAVMAEQRVKSPLMTRIVAMVRKLLRRLGFKVMFSANDLLDLIARAGRYVETAVEPTVAVEGQPLFSADKAPKRDYTSEQQEAIDKGGFGKKGKSPLREKFNEARYRIKTKLRQGVVDQFDSFESILKDNRAWMMAHLTKASAGALEATIQYGQPFMSENAVDIDVDKKSLQEILQPLEHELNDWLMWIAGNRAERLSTEDKERLFSDVDIKALKSLNQGKMANGKDRAKVYEAVRKDFEQMNDAIVKIGVDTGLIGADERAAWKEQGFYLPFYRMLETEGKTQGPRSFGGGLVKQTAYKKLKGADLQIGDLLSNVMLNWNHLLSASLNNQAAVKALDTAEGMGLADEVSESEKGKKAVFVRKDGKKVWYDVAQGQDGALILDSLMSLNWVGLNTTSMKVMKKFKRALTIGVTASPSFKIRNLMRDSIQAIAVADMSTQIHKNLYQGWKATREKSKTKARMIAGGGAFGDSGYIHGADPDAIRYLVDKGVARETILDSRNHIGKMWDVWQDFGSRLENVNRAANFEQAIEEGRDLLTANFESRDHLDFARTGSFTAVRALSQVVPFLNARLQGLDKLGRAGMSKEQRKQFTVVVGVYSLASVMLYLLMKDDDDFKAAEDWERDAYHLFKLPGDDDTMYRLPRPFEVGAIASVMERMVEQMVDDDVHGELFAERLSHTILETLSFNPMPQAFKPAFEVYSNKNSFTGRQIESASMKNLSPTERKRAWTSETAIWASGRMDDITWGKVVLSPVQMEHLVRGYLGWAGATVLGSVDMLVTRPLSGAPDLPSKEFTELPVIKSFARTVPGRSSKFTTLFYNNMREINEAYADIRNARKLGEMEKAEKLLEEGRGKLKWRKAYNSLQSRLSKINAKITRIRLDKDMDPDDKRDQIKELSVKKNQYSRKLVEMSSNDLR